MTDGLEVVEQVLEDRRQHHIDSADGKETMGEQPDKALNKLDEVEEIQEQIKEKVEQG